MRAARRGRRRNHAIALPRLGLICTGASLLAFAWVPAHGGAAVAGTSRGATFRLTGALNGTLHVTPGNCSSEGGAGSFYSSGKLKGPRTTTGWTIQITSPKNGTFKLHQGKPPDVNVSSGGEHAWGFNANGTVTIKGNSGKVNTDLSSTNASKIHIKGSWICPSN